MLSSVGISAMKKDSTRVKKQPLRFRQTQRSDKDPRKLQCCGNFSFDKNLEFHADTRFEDRCIAIGDAAQRKRIYHALDIDQETTETSFRSNLVRTTHYRWWYFVPLNLFHQFRRYINLYFLITLIICFAIPLAPVDPLTWFYGLLAIVLLSMGKQGYEDYMRYRKDL